MLRPRAKGSWGLGCPDGFDGLLSRFCELSGIREELTPSDRKKFVQEIFKAYQTYVAAALDHNASFDKIELEDQTPSGTYTQATAPEVHETYAEVVRRYLVESERAGADTAEQRLAAAFGAHGRVSCRLHVGA